MTENYKSGFVSIIGRPNVGKSTLMNEFLNEKLSIISPKPQTTRNKIKTILTKEDYQIIFIDTPGLHSAKTKLGEYMVKSAENSLKEIDVVLFLVEAKEKIDARDKELIAIFKNLNNPVFLVINKIDLIEKSVLLNYIDEFSKLYDFQEIVPISALKGINREELLSTVKKYLPYGPQYFPDDMITDQTERQIVSELIREKALYLLQDEIPHGIAVEVTAMKMRTNGQLMDVEATIYCEKESHKGIVIGKKGAILKNIGVKARTDIERNLGHKVNLQLWVKVKKEWRDSQMFLKSLGYDNKNI